MRTLSPDPAAPDTNEVVDLRDDGTVTPTTPRVDASTPTRRAPGLVRRATALAGWSIVIGGALLLLVPALLGYDRYAIVGGSMSGTFERGSLALAHDVPIEDLRVGDVITYRPPPRTGVDELVTHRIVSLRTDPASGATTLRTKGDANATIDPWAFQLTGPRQNVVDVTIPGVGWVLIALSDPSIRLLVIGVPATLAALWALIDLFRAVRGSSSPGSDSR